MNPFKNQFVISSAFFIACMIKFQCNNWLDC